MTLLDPFRPPQLVDEELIAEVRGLLAAFGSFDAEFARVRFFPAVVYLAPEPAARFLDLTEAIVSRWPEHQPYGGAHTTVIPHLTIIESDDPSLREEVAAELPAALPLRVHVAEALLLVEDAKGIWRRRAALPLGP